MKNNKAVLFVIGGLDIGGVTTVLRQYVSILNEEGYKIIILCQRGSYPDSAFFRNICNYVEIREVERKSMLGRIKDGWSYYWVLNKVYKENEVDIVHLHLTWSGIYSLLHWKTWTIPMIYTFHGAYDLEAKDYINDKVTSKIATVFVRKTLQFLILVISKRVVVLSKYSKDLIVNHFKYDLSHKIVVIDGCIEG